jgi:hypothetical protein
VLVKERRQNLAFKISLFSGIFQRTVQPLSEALRSKKEEEEVEDKKNAEVFRSYFIQTVNLRRTNAVPQSNR